MPPIERSAFIREFTGTLREGSAALFVGAGISRAAGYVDWKELLSDIAKDLGLDIDRESDLVTLAQFHVNYRGGRDRINQLLIDEFLEHAELTSNHHLIATLPVSTVWTTNYDDLLETAFAQTGKRIDVKRRQEDFAVTRRRADVSIFKMHGDKTLPAEAVLTREDYESYEVSRKLFTIALKSDLAQRTFLFLGFSFTDPNIMYILGRVKQLLETNSRKHFCILRAPKPGDGSDGEYQVRRFSHWLDDLRRYNIQPVLIDSYSEVTEILVELNRRSHLRDVFISGSAADFSPLGPERFKELCWSLGAELIRRGYNIICGFGLGVGDMVVGGAIQALPRNDDERLQLWPFPQELPVGTDRAAFWRQYRQRMIGNAGVCVVLAGNKSVNGEIVAAQGVREEVEIALGQRIPVIPVGATGHVASELWTQCNQDLKPFVGQIDIRAALATLGDPHADTQALVRAVMDILKGLDN